MHKKYPQLYYQTSTIYGHFPDDKVIFAGVFWHAVAMKETQSLSLMIYNAI